MALIARIDASKARFERLTKADTYSCMWDSASDILDNGRVQCFSIRRDRKPLSYSEVLHGWQHDERFRTFFIQLLAEARFAAYRWEAPPVTAATVGRPFEFVLLETPGLDRAADAEAFADQFRSAADSETVIAFPNLGNDAVLVVPRPAGQPPAYAHLAAFLRQAPDAQKHELWRVVAGAMEARLGAEPVWLSTAGMGVSWLHVRLDSRPKYYGFRAYAENA